MEKEKLTLATIFIATYTTLIFAIPNLIPQDTSLIHAVIYAVFVFAGLFIDLMFFLYITFYALEMSSIKEIPFFELEVTKDQARKIKNHFFNFGIYSVLYSFSMPIASIMLFLKKYFNLWIVALIFIVIFQIIMLSIRWLIKRLSK